MVHDREYILKIKDGTLSEKENRRLGLQWSKNYYQIDLSWQSMVLY